MNTYKDKKNNLNKYLTLLYRYQDLKNRLYNPKSPSLSEEKGISDKTLVERLSELDEIKKQMDNIYISIIFMEDIQLRYVLEYKYIEGYSLETIALKMHFSVSHIKRMHKTAIEAYDFEKDDTK